MPFGKIVSAGVVSCLLILSFSALPVSAQHTDAERVGLPHDWSHHHVIFTHTPTPDLAAHPESAKRLQGEPRLLAHVINSNARRQALARREIHDVRFSPHKHKPKVDWAISLGSGGTSLNQYPGKYTFDVTAAPDCVHDYAVYGVNVAGSSTQPNIVGFNYLYSGSGSGLCDSITPAAFSAAVYFSYNVSAIGGAVLTSPVISLDGSKIAFVESKAGSSPHFHVLAFKAGDGVNALNPVDVTKPVQITAGFVATQPSAGQVTDLAYSPACTAGNSNSSPYIDYATDTAYVGDDCGNIVRIQNVFCPNASCNVAPSLDTSFNAGAAAFNVCGTNVTTAPVLDPLPTGTGAAFMGCSDGRLYKIMPGTSFINATRTSQGGGGAATNGGVSDPPLVDTGNGFVFWNNPSNGVGAVLVQNTTVRFGFPAVTAVGQPGVAPVHSGTFNDPYFDSTDSTTWALFSCGFATAAGHPPELFSIRFTAGGILDYATLTANTQGMGSTAGAQCSPITDFVGGDSTDRIFFGITSGTVDVFAIGTASSNTFNSSTIPATAAENGGTSGIIIDNTSNAANASSFYFSTLGDHKAVKLTQSGLQ